MVEYNTLLDKKKEQNSTTAKEEVDLMNQTEAVVEAQRAEYLLLSEGRVIESFLKKSASQLTYAGVLELYNTMTDRQFAVFFRNNHFSSLFFCNGQLFILVTDLGYLHEPTVVWELLDGIDG